MLSDDITALAGKIASVPEDDWNVSAKALGYPVQSTELEGLSIAFSRQDTGAFTAIQDRAGNVVNILPAADQAAYVAHTFTQGAVTTTAAAGDWLTGLGLNPCTTSEQDAQIKPAPLAPGELSWKMIAAIAIGLFLVYKFA